MKNINPNSQITINNGRGAVISRPPCPEDTDRRKKLDAIAYERELREIEAAFDYDDDE